MAVKLGMPKTGGLDFMRTITSGDFAFYRQVGAFDKSVASVKWQ